MCWEYEDNSGNDTHVIYYFLPLYDTIEYEIPVSVVHVKFVWLNVNYNKPSLSAVIHWNDLRGKIVNKMIRWW